MTPGCTLAGAVHWNDLRVRPSAREATSTIQAVSTGSCPARAGLQALCSHAWQSAAYWQPHRLPPGGSSTVVTPVPPSIVPERSALALAPDEAALPTVAEPTIRPRLTNKMRTRIANSPP